LFPITSEANALPFQTISLDFIIKLLVSDGHNTILTVTDHDCSKAAFFIPCNETIDAAGVATLYATHIFPHYGLPKKVSPPLESVEVEGAVVVRKQQRDYVKPNPEYEGCDES